jgi:hypothetical protein
VDRAAALTDIVANGNPSDPFVANLQALFGTSVSVQEFQDWVRMNCETPPPAP